MGKGPAALIVVLLWFNLLRQSTARHPTTETIGDPLHAMDGMAPRSVQAMAFAQVKPSS